MRIRIGHTFLFLLIAAFALGCSSQGDGAGGGGLEETISSPSDTLTKAEEELMASAEGQHAKALADLPSETNSGKTE